MKDILMMGLTPPEEGGSERHIFEISSRLDNVNVLTQKNSICKNKIGIKILKSSTLLRNVSFAVSAFLYSLILVFSLRKKYRTIHIHENLLYFLTPLLKIRYNVVVTVHGIKGFKFYDNKILWFIFKQPLKLANRVISVNLEDKKILEKELKRVSYVPNGVDLFLYKNINAKIENKISFIGRIHEQKGLVYLLEAFDKIKGNYPNFKLCIIGEINDYARELQKKFQDKRVIWKGFLSDREDIVRTLKSSYCIVLPSLWEGLPLTLFESLASGRPVIVSDIPAFKSVIKNEALFFDSKDSKDLKIKIEQIIENPKYANSLGGKGLKLSEEYDWSNIAKETKEVYYEK